LSSLCPPIFRPKAFSLALIYRKRNSVCWCYGYQLTIHTPILSLQTYLPNSPSHLVFTLSSYSQQTKLSFKIRQSVLACCFVVLIPLTQPAFCSQIFYPFQNKSTYVALFTHTKWQNNFLQLRMAGITSHSAPLSFHQGRCLSLLMAKEGRLTDIATQ
jgi:hypothetical protein